MGLAESVTTQQVVTDISTTAINSCPSSQASNYFSANNITYTCPDGCPPEDCVFEVDQTATVDAACYITALQQTAAQQLSNVSQDTKSAIGLNLSYTATDIQTQLSNTVINECGDVPNTVNNQVVLTNADINACGMFIIQNATDNQICQINATQDIINNVTNEILSETQGSSLTQLLFGSGLTSVFIILGILIFIFIVIAVILIVVVLVKKSKKKPDNSNENSFTSGIDDDINFGGKADSADNETSTNGRRNKSIYILVGLGIVLLAAVLYYSTRNEKKITDNEINYLKNNLNQAKQFANLSPMSASSDIWSSPISHNVIHNQSRQFVDDLEHYNSDDNNYGRWQ